MRYRWCFCDHLWCWFHHWSSLFIRIEIEGISIWFSSLFKLFAVVPHILSVQFLHLFDLVQINDETIFIGMVTLDTLTTEHGLMVRTIEVLQSLRVCAADEVLFVTVIEVDGFEDWIILCHLVEHVDIEWKSLNIIEALQQLPADRAADALSMVQLSQALSAESVSTVYEYTRNAFANVVSQSTEMTEVKFPA